MWNAAYQAVKEKDAKLVKTYEKVVSQHVVGGMIDINALADCSEEERLGRMKIAVLRCVEKAKKHENFRNGVIQTSAVIVNLNKVVSGFLTASPPAAMAWSGICAVLPMLISPWESSDVFSALSDSVEQRIVDLYQEVLQFEMWSTTWCFQDHAVAKGLKTMVGLVDWATRRNDIEKIEATLDKDLGQYANREIVRQLRGLFDQQEMFHEEKARRVREEQHKKAYEIAGRFKTTDYEGRLKLNPDRPGFERPSSWSASSGPSSISQSISSWSLSSWRSRFDVKRGSSQVKLPPLSCPTPRPVPPCQDTGFQNDWAKSAGG
ncbi:ankyrin repeat-containing protein [Colletotrichum plurivorum]|uniref:Ankyrin repeat-containing protein n=1 Tax=Colletotrichum plurivorum TaxID=2175906 RepID=A0A8H6JX22_9PEZI|nr:ankyrin repeat-containing protein [Colletotrichum plurivorum]